MTINTISAAGSMKGYKLSIWWSKNKETIKTLFSSGVAIGLFFLPSIPDPATSAAVAVVGGALSKLAVDTLDFWCTDVQIPLPNSIAKCNTINK